MGEGDIMSVETAGMMGVDFVARCIACYAAAHGGSGVKPSDYQSGGKYYGMAGNMVWLIRGTNITVNGSPKYILTGTSITINGTAQAVLER